MLVVLQLALFGLFILLAWVAWPALSGWNRTVSRHFRKLARHRRLAVLLVGLFTFASSTAVTWTMGLPQPVGHDEFSYLLQADTFAHGRLTNPPHPLWEHFESPHIIQQPTYASKYPPAQGLFLAAGKLIGGHPIVGVWFAVALAAAAICWMLQAWLPSHWALAGGLLAALQMVFFGRAPHALGLPGYWSQTYWGGAVAALGGALLFGALRRVVRSPRVTHAALFALGLAILANSRPIEGLVVSLPAVTLLLGWLIKNRRFLGWRAVTKVVVPIAAVLLLTAAGMLWYNFRITGNPLRMAYQEHEEQYGAVPAMFWQRLPAEKTYRHAAIRDFHFSYEITRYREQQSLPGWSVIAVAKAKMVMSYAMDGVVFVLPWLVLAWIMRNRWMRFAALTCGLLAVLLLQETFTLPHYVAPVTCLFFAMVMQGFRHIRLWRWHGQPLGRAVIAAVPVVCLATLAFSLVTDVRSADPRSAPIQRARLISQLREDRAKHLIIVRYGAEPAYDGWVYNEADIDAAPVVWAREMDAEHNHRLLAYFHDRRVWLLDTDIQPAVLVPYPDDYATQRVAGDVHGSH